MKIVPTMQPTLQQSRSQAAAIWLLSVYKRLLSPRLEERGFAGRFTLSRSDYSRVAVEKYGAIQGIVMSAGRLARCRPNNHASCFDYP